MGDGIQVAVRCAAAAVVLALATVTAPVPAGAQSQATCAAYLATNPNPAGIASVSGPGVAQRSAFLADGGKLVAIGARYYAAWFPPAFFTASIPVVVFDLHGTGGYPEAEWNDWHAALGARGFAFIGLAWGGGTPGAATDTEIYDQLKQIVQEVGAACPIADARQWLMGFSVGSAMSFAVMIRDVADRKMFSGQVAVSGAAIGPLTTGIGVMHATVEANRANTAAVQGTRAWMYCGAQDFDHGWSMCTEMPYGLAFVNEHGGSAVLYEDPTGTHHGLPSNATAIGQMADYILASGTPATNPTRLANIATRGRALTGDSVLIGGFTIGGTTAKKVLVTARGPSMAAQGVTGTLADPFLTLYSGATPIATNDDFGSAANASEIPASMRPGSAKEAAILTTLAPGAYTAIVTGVGGATGIAIVEVFEVDTPDSPLVNIATRGPVQTGDFVLIGGFIIQGDVPQTVLVTARGPSLGVAPHNVPGTLADPVLQVLSGQTVVASNDDWETNANVTAIRATGVAPTNAKEAAVLTSLNPGAYTVIVTGSGGSTGIGIVEVFALADPPTGVAVANVGTQTVGSSSFSSSTKLAASWTAPSGASVDHYEVTATDAVTGTSETFTASGSATSTQLTGLKSATTYSVVVAACLDSGCSRKGAAAAVTGTTAEEHWQLQGSGNTISGLTKVVSDGNVRVAVLRYGADAPDAVKNRLQLYYGPNSLGTRSGLATALTAAAADAANPATFLSFTSGAGSTGLQNPVSPSTLVKQVSTGQAVPLASAGGALVRLYFEGNGQDGRTRILSIDSKDGYVGRDFNAGGSTVCQNAEEYATGGSCEPKVVIAVDSDTGGNAKIANARQFKIGFPMQTDWRWDEAVGTFMVFTVDAITGCTVGSHNQAYAQWTGSQWEVKYEANGCPKLMTYMQAATPVHLGGVRYKLYYGDRTDNTGVVTGSTLPFLGPKRVLYADGTRTGDATTVEFEDWEATTSGRGVTFLWPGGEKLDATAEGYIDDFMAVAPTGSLDTQAFYVAITDGTIPPFVAGALLLNP